MAAGERPRLWCGTTTTCDATGKSKRLASSEAVLTTGEVTLIGLPRKLRGPCLTERRHEAQGGRGRQQPARHHNRDREAKQVAEAGPAALCTILLTSRHQPARRAGRMTMPGRCSPAIGPLGPKSGRVPARSRFLRSGSARRLRSTIGRLQPEGSSDGLAGKALAQPTRRSATPRLERAQPGGGGPPRAYES